MVRALDIDMVISNVMYTGHSQVLLWCQLVHFKWVAVVAHAALNRVYLNHVPLPQLELEHVNALAEVSVIARRDDWNDSLL